jgi:hypothetical protein
MSNDLASRLQNLRQALAAGDIEQDAYDRGLERLRATYGADRVAALLAQAPKQPGDIAVTISTDSGSIESSPVSVVAHADQATFAAPPDPTLAREERAIAVEIKGFFGPLPMADLQQAVGQYLVYASWMRRIDPARELWLAISEDTYTAVFDRIAGQAVVDDYHIRLLVVDVEAERIRAWKQP